MRASFRRSARARGGQPVGITALSAGPV